MAILFGLAWIGFNVARNGGFISIALTVIAAIGSVWFLLLGWFAMGAAGEAGKSKIMGMLLFPLPLVFLVSGVVAAKGLIVF